MAIGRGKVFTSRLKRLSAAIPGLLPKDTSSRTSVAETVTVDERDMTKNTEKQRPGLDNLPPELLFSIFSHLRVSEFFPLKMAGSRYLLRFIRELPRTLPTLDEYVMDLFHAVSISESGYLRHWSSLTKLRLLRNRSCVIDKDNHHLVLTLAACRGQNALIIATLLRSKQWESKSIWARKGDKLPKIENHLYRSALSFAAMHGNLHTIKLLCQYRDDPLWYRDSEGNSLLDYAASTGQIEVARYLLQNGCSPNSSAKERKKEMRNSKGTQAPERLYGSASLIWAIQGEHVEMVKLLLAAGASKHLGRDIYQGHQSENPMEEALSLGNFEIVRILKEPGALLEKDILYRPLQSCIESGNVEMVRYLCDNGAPVNEFIGASQSSWGKALPLHIASEMGNNEVIDILLEHGASIYQRHYMDDSSPIWNAARYGHLKTVQYLIEKGADINTVGGLDRCSLIHQAMRGGHLDIVKFLVANGACVEITDRCGHSAFSSAVMRDTTELLEMLLNVGPNSKATDGTWKDAISDALLTAVESGKTEAIEKLLQHKLDINVKDAEGQTALHKAAENGHLKTISLLVRKGADIKAKDKRGETPAHAAAYAWEQEAKNLLISLGADPSERDAAGNTVALAFTFHRYSISHQMFLDGTRNDIGGEEG